MAGVSGAPRVLYLADLRTFKLFVGLVLLYFGGRNLYEITGRAQKSKAKLRELDNKFAECIQLIRNSGIHSQRQGSRRMR